MNFLSLFLILQISAVNYYHKALHLGSYSSPRSASKTDVKRQHKLYMDNFETFFLISALFKHLFNIGKISIFLVEVACFVNSSKRTYLSL